MLNNNLLHYLQYTRKHMDLTRSDEGMSQINKLGISKFFTVIALAVLLIFAPLTLVSAEDVVVSGVVDYSAAQRMLELVNNSRAAEGLSPLAYNYSLESYAKLRAAEISVYNAHIRPNGTNVSYSENYSIGWGSADQAHSAFMGSAGHRANIMNPNYTSMAGGVININGRLYWVQVFTAGGGTGAPTGLSGTSSESFTINVANNAPAASYSNLDDQITVKVGGGVYIKTGINSQIVSASWSSDKPGIATVNAQGYVKGIAPGVALVTGQVQNQSVRVQVTVVSSDKIPGPANTAVQQPTAPAATVAPVPSQGQYAPTAAPAQETTPSYQPTQAPTFAPTAVPTYPPTTAPTVMPSTAPTSTPSPSPTPTPAPTTVVHSQESTSTQFTEPVEAESETDSTRPEETTTQENQARQSFINLDKPEGISGGLRTALIIASATGLVISLSVFIISIKGH